MTQTIVAGGIQQAAGGDYIYPVLPGYQVTCKRTPTFSTIVQTAADRSQARIGLDPYPLYAMELQYGYFRDFHEGPTHPITNPLGYTELEQIEGFFLAMGGKLTSFLLDLGMLTKKKSDNIISGQLLGVGDGANKSFQVVRQIGPFLEAVQNLAGAPTVYVNDAPVSSGWTVDSNGIIAFTTAPTSGKTVKVDARFYYRCTFAEDTTDFQLMQYALYADHTIKLVQARN